jgi:hypothetical protein
VAAVAFTTVGGAVVVVGLTVAVSGGLTALPAVSYALAVGVAAIGYERTGTTWVPVLVYAGHAVAEELAYYLVLSGPSAGGPVVALAALV